MHCVNQLTERHTTMRDRLAQIEGDLENIAERLTELSVDVLREALDSGETKRPDVDKKLSQARRAVEKAARLLSEEAARHGGQEEQYEEEQVDE